MRSRSKTPAGSDRSSGILETASETLSPAGLGAARVINTAPISPIQPSIHPSAHHLSLFLSLLSIAMCTIAPRAAAPGFGATAFLDRQRGVVAAVAPTATSGHNAGEPTRLIARASEVSTATARKRGRHDGFEHVVVDPAASSALRIRMDAELVALQGLLKRAKLLPRSAPPAENKCAPPPRRSEAPVVSSEAKRTTSSQPKAATEAEAAYHQTQITAPAANSKQQQRPAAKNLIVLEVPSKQKQQRPAETPAAAKQQQHPVQRAAAAKTEVPKKRRPEEEKELARAAAREQFRQMLLEMEKSALPDETIYPEDLQELGIPFEFVVTRTWKQALEDHAKKVEFVGV